jgi:hypothetical protein
VVLAVAAGPAPAAEAAPGAGPTAIVSLGDSFISGQAGRWQGNSNNALGSRAGTDRACVMSATGCRYDVGRVYLGGTRPPGCARSDVAEIHSARISVDERINLACSGAMTANIFRSPAGGRVFKREAPQADQLAHVARARDVKLVVLSIGGNDIGFQEVVTACVLAYVTRAPPCADRERRNIEARLPRAVAGVRKAIDEIRAVMRSAGYRPWHYRLVLQSYPSPVPRAAENRYPEAGPARGAIGNCPLYDRDLDEARDTLVPRLDGELRAIALEKGAQFLSLRDTLQGREMCARTARLADASNPPSAATSEWARFIGLTAILQGETIEEEAHPNAYAQRALGGCLTLLFARATGSWACRNTPGRGTDAMILARVYSLRGRFRLRLRASPRRVRAGRRRCFRFRALSGGQPVERVTVRFAGTRGRTSRTGRVRKCVRLRRARRYRATARRSGFRPASVTVGARRPASRPGR